VTELFQDILLVVLGIGIGVVLTLWFSRNDKDLV